MGIREYLVQLIKRAVGGTTDYWAGLVADMLIAHGVIAVEPVELCDGCRWKGKRPQRCSCCRRNRYLKDGYEEG